MRNSSAFWWSRQSTLSLLTCKYFHFPFINFHSEFLYYFDLHCYSLLVDIKYFGVIFQRMLSLKLSAFMNTDIQFLMMFQYVLTFIVYYRISYLLNKIIKCKLYQLLDIIRQHDFLHNIPHSIERIHPHFCSTSLSPAWTWLPASTIANFVSKLTPSSAPTPYGCWCWPFKINMQVKVLTFFDILN